MAFSQQSPINLTHPIHADLGAGKLELGWKGKTTGFVVKEKEGVKVQFLPGNRQSIKLGGEQYHLDSLHFHHPSEHVIDGKPCDMELHIVHSKVDDGAHFAVVAVFIDLNKKAPVHSTMNPLLNAVCKCLHHSGEEGDGSHVTIEMQTLLPERDHEYYRYEGSLTTGEFSENVSWVVMKNRFQVSAEELGELIHEFKKPARNPFPLNRRFLLATFGPEESQTASHESVAQSDSKKRPPSRPKPQKKS